MKLNPHILIWARETAGLSVDEAAHALGFKDTHDRTAAERLQAMETGKEDPSRSVLLGMARAYHRSLLVFYLSEPPRTGDRGQDFRRAPGVTPLEYDPTLDALIRDIRPGGPPLAQPQKWVPHPSRFCEGWETAKASPVLAFVFALLALNA